MYYICCATTGYPAFKSVASIPFGLPKVLALQENQSRGSWPLVSVYSEQAAMHIDRTYGSSLV
jgi:hypothetical protein